MAVPFNLVPIADGLMLLALCFLTTVVFSRAESRRDDIKDLQLPKVDGATSGN